MLSEGNRSVENAPLRTTLLPVLVQWECDKQTANTIPFGHDVHVSVCLKDSFGRVLHTQWRSAAKRESYFTSGEVEPLH